MIGCWIALSFTLGDPAWEHVALSAYAVDTRTGKVILDEGGEKNVTPASCLKVVTTLAALEMLGEDLRFKTEVGILGSIDPQGVLCGDVYVKGGGDPCLGSGRCGALSLDLEVGRWVEAVKLYGIRKIEGRVVVDDFLWERRRAVASWLFEDVGNYYGAGASALSFHENAYDLVLRCEKHMGMKTELLRTEPSLEMLGLKIDNEVTMGAVGSGDRAFVYGSEFSHGQLVLGTVPLGSPYFTIRGALGDPPLVCGRCFKKALAEGGVLVRGDVVRGRCDQGVVLHTTLSPTVREIVYETNQRSHNLYAEHLLKKMGEKIEGIGSTEGGINVVLRFLKNLGVGTRTVHLEDGSGLSRKNRLSAKVLTMILKEARTRPFFPSFFYSLTEVKPGVKVKRGSMSSVRGYVGYAGDIIFAILANDVEGLDFEKKCDAFFEKVQLKDQ